MIQLHGIHKAFPDKILFKDLDLVIKRGARVGLVGANGSGKTTLLRMITREEEPDSGQVQVDRKVTLGYLPQEITSASRKTILHEVLDQIPEVGELERKMELLSEQIAARPEDTRLLAQLGRCQAEFERLNGWTLESEAKQVLGGLGFAPDQMDASLETFSGGWRMRVALAKLLFIQPDILLLDEPTNHLDLHSLIWLETFLKEWPGALMLISHDRTFLDKTVNHIYEIDHLKIQVYPGNFTHYIQAKQLAREQQLAAFRNQQKLIEETERFIERFRYKDSKASQVQSRVKKLEKLERILPPEGEGSSLAVRIPQPDRSPRIVAEFRAAAKSYGPLEVFRNLDLSLERGQKVGLVGPNGAGKSTLLKMLAGVEALNGGSLIWGSGVRRSYFAQHQFESLPMDSTLFDLIAQAAPQWTMTEIRSYLGSFLFSGDSVDKQVKVLSGGEVSRLALARMLAQPSELILLDEPTNHLDMRSRDVVQEAVASYTGTMVCISHDRHFLNAVTDSIIEVKAGTVTIYPGNYEYYLWRRDQEGVEQANRVTATSGPTQPSAANLDYQARKKMSNRLKKLPEIMENCEAAIAEQQAILDDPDNAAEYEKIQAAMQAKEKLEEEYLLLMEELEELETNLA